MQPLSEEDAERLTHFVMRRQATLSLSVGAIFVVLLLGLPLLNLYAPQIAQTPILGFPASWLFLGILFYPITVLLSFYFVRQSDKIEAESVHWREILEKSDKEAKS